MKRARHGNYLKDTFKVTFFKKVLKMLGTVLFLTNVTQMEVNNID